VSPPNYFDGQPVRSRGPDYFADAGKPKKADWKKHEKDVAKRAHERQVTGSGNKPGRPGDVTGSKFLREGKATRRASITVSQKWMEKLVVEALRMGRIPVFEVRLEGARLPVPSDWVLLPAIDFQAIVDGEK